LQRDRRPSHDQHVVDRLHVRRRRTSRARLAPTSATPTSSSANAPCQWVIDTASEPTTTTAGPTSAAVPAVPQLVPVHFRSPEASVHETRRAATALPPDVVPCLCICSLTPSDLVFAPAGWQVRRPDALDVPGHGAVTASVTNSASLGRGGPIATASLCGSRYRGFLEQVHQFSRPVPSEGVHVCRDTRGSWSRSASSPRPSSGVSHRGRRISSAARSAIITVGAFVFPLGSVGITEASATRSPSTPRTLKHGSTGAPSSSPIRAVPTG
jgi:hypothetical protein